MSAFDDPGEPDDGLFFAGIGADDEDVTEEVEDEDAVLAETVVRPDDEETGSAPMPLLGMGAGVGGAAGLGAYAGQTRADHEKSRSGVAGTPAALPLGAVRDESGDFGVDAYGRVIKEDPWGVGDSDDVPAAHLSGAATSEAPRTRGGSGTRGSHLSRNDGLQGQQAAVPGATLGGIGSMPTNQVAATTTAGSGSQQGGIPLSVLQNLQNNKANSAAFAPMTGVQASGTHGYMSDPSIVVAQAFGVVGADGVNGEEWLRKQLQEHEHGRRIGAEMAERGGAEGVNGPDSEATEEDSSDGGKDGSHRGGGREAGAAVAGGVAVGGGWGGGSSTSGSAPVMGGTQAPAVTRPQGDTGWGGGPVSAPAGGWQGTRAAGTQNDGTTQPTVAPVPGSTGTAAPTGIDGGSYGTGYGSASADDHHGQRDTHTRSPQSWAEVFARGTDFSVVSDRLTRDADQWRRLALEMEGVTAVLGSIRDGDSSFGLITEPAGAYTRATHQSRLWSVQATKAYEGMANQLNVTAAGYTANEQSAVDNTGRVFEA